MELLENKAELIQFAKELNAEENPYRTIKEKTAKQLTVLGTGEVIVLTEEDFEEIDRVWGEMWQELIRAHQEAIESDEETMDSGRPLPRRRIGERHSSPLPLNDSCFPGDDERWMI